MASLNDMKMFFTTPTYERCTEIACLCPRVRACARACVCVCERARVCARMCACARAYMRINEYSFRRSYSEQVFLMP